MFALLVLCSAVTAPTQGRSGGRVLNTRWPDSAAARPLADRRRSSQNCSLSFGPPALLATTVGSIRYCALSPSANTAMAALPPLGWGIDDFRAERRLKGVGDTPQTPRGGDRPHTFAHVRAVEA